MKGKDSKGCVTGRPVRPAGWWLLAAALPGLAGPLWAQPAAPVTAAEQMIVTANPHATEAGLAMLRAGGSAVDAAIAAQAVLSMVEPQSSGIGGGAFLLHFDADAAGESAVSAFQGRERAPASAGEDLFLDHDGRALAFAQIAWGGLSVGVPGVMRMLELAHREHGRLPWAALFEPAIELAETGFEISPRLYFLLSRFEQQARARSFRAHYFDADGHALAAGTRLVNAPYAESLRRIAREGADTMYTGRLAEEIIATVRGNALSHGDLTAQDLSAYRAEQLPALCSAYRDYTVCGPQLPSSGGMAVLQVLGMLAAFPLGQGDDIRTMHLVAEASRLAFADRDFFAADPEFVAVPVRRLLDPGYLAGRAALIDPARAMPTAAPGQPAGVAALNLAAAPPSELASTTHLSVIDAWGDAVSMTSSVQSTFGSQLMVGGFLLNNQLTDFATVPRVDGRPVANRPEGGKRPLSSQSPTIVLDGEGRVRLLIGSPGGTRIIGYVTQALVGVLDRGLDIQQAVAAPHYLARYDELEIEADSALLGDQAALEALGHRVSPRSLNSGLHGIVVDYTAAGRRLSGGVDPRREGLALGD